MQWKRIGLVLALAGMLVPGMLRAEENDIVTRLDEIVVTGTRPPMHLRLAERCTGGNHNAICDDIGANRKYIIYGGDDEFPVSNDVTVVSLPRFVKKFVSG